MTPKIGTGAKLFVNGVELDLRSLFSPRVKSSVRALVNGKSFTITSCLPAYHCWREENPDPDLATLLRRYIDVCETIARHRVAGIEPHVDWLEEVGASIWSDP